MRIGVSLVVMAGGLLFYALVLAPPPASHHVQAIGPLAFPIGILISLLFLSLVLVGSGLRDKRQVVSKDENEGAAHTSKMVTLGIMGSLLLYIVSLHVLGFALATVSWLAFSLYIFGTKRPILIFGLSVGIGGVLFLLFTRVLLLPLPAGLWIFESFSRLIRF